MQRTDLWQAAAEPLDADPQDWHPRPRYTGKCVGCGRFVPNAGHRLSHNHLTGETVELGHCGRCGEVVVE